MFNVLLQVLDDGRLTDGQGRTVDSLRRTIQREVDNRLSGLLLSGELPPGTHIRVDGDLNISTAASVS